MGNSNKQYAKLLESLQNENYLSTSLNNKLLFLFLKHKQLGRYGRLVFPITMNSERTGLRIALHIKRFDDFFKTDFIELTEDNICKFRDALVDNTIYQNKTIVKWNNGSYTAKVEKTTKPLSYATKLNLRSILISFAHFLKEYCYQQNIPPMDDIMGYFTIPRESDYKDVKVEFIPSNQINELLENIRNKDFKALVMFCLASGARPIEALNTKYGENIYKNTEKRYVQHLPCLKRISYRKFPHILNMYEEYLYPYFDRNYSEGDLVFKITSATFGKLMHHYTEKYLGKRYTPKVLRKTARMIRSNAGYTDDQINKFMGHSPSSKIQDHYTNYEGIEDNPDAGSNLKKVEYVNFKQDQQELKLKLEALQQELLEIKAKQIIEYEENKSNKL